jgi:hypothetical protein
MNRTVLLTILYSSNCFMIISTIDRIRDMLCVEMKPANPLNMYHKCMLGFNFSLLGLSAFTLIGLNRLIIDNIKK